MPVSNVAITSLYNGLDPKVLKMSTLAMTWWTDTSVSPDAYIKRQLEWVIPRIRQQPKGCRTMWLNNILERDAATQVVDPLVAMRNGIDTKTVMAALLPLSKRLKYARLPVDLLFCDLEGGFNYWQIGKDEVQRVLRDSKARANLPPYIRAIDPAWLDDWTSPANVNSIRLWNRWNAQFILGTLKKILLDSGMFDIPDPILGRVRRPAVVNFSSHIQRWSTIDFNGWTLTNASVDGRSSNPSLYLEGGMPSWFDRYVHEPAWNFLIYSINIVRSTLGDPNCRSFPILDRPRGRNPWLWEQIVAHSIRAGVTVKNGNWFLYWNPLQLPEDDAIAGEVFTRHDVDSGPAVPLPKIAYDVDVIETNGFRTTYAEFLEQYNGHGTVVGDGAGAVVGRP